MHLAGQRGQHLTGLVAIVVDRLLAEDHEAGLLCLDHALQELSDGERLDGAIDDNVDATVAPIASAVRIVSAACAGPMETAITSVALPASFCRNASSKAISSNGFIDILTLASSTPDPPPQFEF